MTYQTSIFKPLIIVEAILGAGKSTFAKQISKRLNLRLLEEPVGNGEGIENPYLEMFYRDPKKWAFPMQIYLLHHRYAMHQLAAYESTGVGGYSGVIEDRSIIGDRVFAKMHKEAGNIEDIDWKTYEKCYLIMCRSLLPPTLLVYLDVQPETAFNRMKKRNRKAEEGVPLEYLIELRKGYQELIKEAEQCLLPWAHAVRIVRIPYDFDVTEESQWDAMANTIKDSCRLTC